MTTIETGILLEVYLMKENQNVVHTTSDIYYVYSRYVFQKDNYINPQIARHGKRGFSSASQFSGWKNVRKFKFNSPNHMKVT